jgi:hypothetical protein
VNKQLYNYWLLNCFPWSKNCRRVKPQSSILRHIHGIAYNGEPYFPLFTVIIATSNDRPCSSLRLSHKLKWIHKKFTLSTGRNFNRNLYISLFLRYVYLSISIRNIFYKLIIICERYLEMYRLSNTNGQIQHPGPGWCKHCSVILKRGLWRLVSCSSLGIT